MISSYTFHVGQFLFLALVLWFTISRGNFLSRRGLMTSNKVAMYIDNDEGCDVSTVCTSNHYKTWRSYVLHDNHKRIWTFKDTDDFYCDMCWFDENNEQFGFGHFHLYSPNALPAPYRADREEDQLIVWLVKDGHLHIRNSETGNYEGRHKSLKLPIADLYKLKHHYQLRTACGKLYPKGKIVKKGN